MRKIRTYKKPIVCVALVISMIFVLFSFPIVHAEAYLNPLNRGGVWDELVRMNLAMWSSNFYTYNDEYANCEKLALTKTDETENAKNSNLKRGLAYKRNSSDEDLYDFFVYFDTTQGQAVVVIPEEVPIDAYNHFVYWYDTAHHYAANLGNGWKNYNYNGSILKLYRVSTAYCNAINVSDNIPKYASPEDAFNSVREIESSDDSSVVRVYADISASYTISLPAIIDIERIDMEGETVYGCVFDVGVKGCLGTDELLKVEPDSSFTMTNEKGETLEGEVSLSKTKFVMTNPNQYQETIRYDRYTYIEGRVFLPVAYAGKWSGNITFTFTKADIEE